ncbi:glutathione S-transferase family protein [Roseomonas sp. 18066]|uniref:glutathione S-transferase family protein n=1 Tax=Roseomonas sp. 18066 TaxID=2681412 RepID=UPI001359CED2|nr:glutathione S-transferase family protein [Roseomonas sp. 18066]
MAGYLDHGQWRSGWGHADRQGRFDRASAQRRNWITPDGSPGPSGRGGFAAEPGRYFLYVARACPWAHRTVIFRRLKGLEGMVGLAVTHWLMADQGWSFEPAPGVIPDPEGARAVHEIYTRDDPGYSGTATVPVLWDRAQRCIVSNESSEIIRMFNSAFDGLGATPGDYYPEALRPRIDALNARIYDTVNNGVYKAGFATSQEAYAEALHPLFASLDWLEDLLSRQRFLCGDTLTEADWRLFTTLLRFDAVYVGHFKCNLRRLVDYPALWSYTRELYQWPGIRETTDFDHIKRHYYMSHDRINPTGIVPDGPLLDFEAPPSRGFLSA